jgi:predicted nucleic acid-binding protein
MRKLLSVISSVKGKLALDSSVLVEIFSDSGLGRSMYSILQQEDVIAYTSRVNLAEASYVICRRLGRDRAQAAVRDLLDSGFVRLEEDLRIHELASELKCERAISFVDCFTFAVAKVTGATPLFAKEEAELTREAKKRPFEIAPIFLSSGEGSP